MKEKFKSWIINLATSGVFPRIVAALVVALATQVMQLWPKIVELGLENVIDPATLIDLLSQFAVAVLLLAVAKWTGKPVKELQEILVKKGVYAGRVDGYAGDDTKTALAEAINDPNITVDQPAAPKRKRFLGIF